MLLNSQSTQRKMTNNFKNYCLKIIITNTIRKFFNHCQQNKNIKLKYEKYQKYKQKYQNYFGRRSS